MPMLRVLIALLALVLADASFARSRGPVTPFGFGAGIVLGEPTGLSGKLALGRRAAVDFLAAYSINNFFLLGSDFLFHFPHAFGSKVAFASELEPYVGVGGSIAISNRSTILGSVSSFGIGVRIPLGIEWVTPSIPVGIYVEVAPGIWLFPATVALIQGGIGVRYYFGEDTAGDSGSRNYPKQQLSR